MVLQKLIQDGHLEVMESLIDMNNTVLKVGKFAKTTFLLCVVPKIKRNLFFIRE